MKHRGKGTSHTLREYNAEWQRRWRKANPDKAKQREYVRSLRRHYGLTHEARQEIEERQNGVCAICGETNGHRRLAVDHSHSTGRIRGLLCARCNLSIERLEAVPGWAEKAALYLKSFE